MTVLRQTDSRPVTFFVTEFVRPGTETEFAAIDDQLVELAEQQPGVLGATRVPVENNHDQTWITIIRFSNRTHLDAWLVHPQREELLAQLAQYTSREATRDVFVSKDSEPLFAQGVVTLVWFFTVPVANTAPFEQITLDIGHEAGRFAGFLGIDVQRPASAAENRWAVMTRWTSSDAATAWENSPRCQKLLRYCSSLSQFERLGAVPTTLSDWLTFNDSTQGRREPVWKMTMLTLLVLYPTVFFLSLYISSWVDEIFASWFSLFLGNLLSVIILSAIMIPAVRFFFRAFLNPTPYRRKLANRVGIAILIVLYLAEMAMFALVPFPNLDL